MNSQKITLHDREVRIGIPLENGKVVDLGQCVLYLLWMSVSTGKFREKEIAPNPEEDARLSGVAHGGTWKEDGQGGEENVAQTRL